MKLAVSASGYSQLQAAGRSAGPSFRNHRPRRFLNDVATDRMKSGAGARLSRSNMKRQKTKIPQGPQMEE
jgi:hypothetical protein